MIGEFKTAEADLLAKRDMLRKMVERRKFRKMDFFKPYPKQLAHFALGLTKRERMLSAGNQQGKTEAGAFEAACHLTGEYPPWWPGRKWDRPTNGWVAGEGGLLTRDGPQLKLCGQPGVDEAWGTGFLPREALVDKSMARGVTDAYDTVQVRHKSGGISTIKFKSYDQGRVKFQTATLDWWWGDEEPPEDVYGELLARIAATDGMGWITFTPLKGRSNVVIRYMDLPSPDRAMTTMTLNDAEHIKPEDRQKLIDGYAAHEREARVNGVPMMGEGRIFTTPEDQVREPAIPWQYVPLHWKKIWGIDFGIGHPFAAVLLAWDSEAGTETDIVWDPTKPIPGIVHILHTIKMPDANAFMHAKAMKSIAATVPIAWPHDGTQREKGSGDELAGIYRREGLAMLGQHATHRDGGLSTEAGVMDLQLRLMVNKLKVAEHLEDWFGEYRTYHRKDGQIVKLHDDLMSATRIGHMMLRYARPVALGSRSKSGRHQRIANDVDFDLF